MAQRSIPAPPKTCNRKMPAKAALLKRTRAQRIPFRPGVRYSNKGRIHSRRPILSSAFFACKTAADHTFRLAGHRTGIQNRLGSELYRLISETVPPPPAFRMMQRTSRPDIGRQVVMTPGLADGPCAGDWF